MFACYRKTAWYRPHPAALAIARNLSFRWMLPASPALSYGVAGFAGIFRICHYTKLGHEHDDADNHQQYVDEA